MRWSIPSLFVALLAAPVVLVSSSALADGPDTCLLATAKSCEYVPPTADCSAQCTPGSFVAECDGSCNVDASASCTGGCQADCTASCMATPGSFSCSETCETSCNQSCMSSCTGDDADCMSDCDADCSNRCQVQCNAVPPMASCTDQCTASCNASCQVQVNIDCHLMCTSSVELPTCTADCMTTQGALFCDGQYVDLATATDACLTYLESQGVTVTETCSSSSMGGSSCSATLGCSASASSVGANGDCWGVLGITGLMMGLGIAVSRRRRRS